MAIRLVLALAAFTLTAGDGAGGMEPSSEELTDAQAIAVGAGRLLGAAGSCNSIPPARLDAVSVQVNRLIEEIVGDDDELTAAHTMYADALVEGKQSLADGKTNCRAVETGLKRLERAVRE
jgi:hypothetical protein